MNWHDEYEELCERLILKEMGSLENRISKSSFEFNEFRQRKSTECYDLKAALKQEKAKVRKLQREIRNAVPESRSGDCASKATRRSR